MEVSWPVVDDRIDGWWGVFVRRLVIAACGAKFPRRALSRSPFPWQRTDRILCAGCLALRSRVFARDGKDSRNPIQGRTLCLGGTLLVDIEGDAGRRVTEQLLNSLDTFTLLAQEAGQRVPEDVPCHPLGNAGRDRGRLNVVLES